MLYVPLQGQARLTDDNQGTTGAEYGTSITANASAHTKGNWLPLILSTAYDAVGIFVHLHNTAVASTRTSVLVDIGVGGSGSETVIIPNLLAGNLPASATTGLGGSGYFFPLRIPAGVRVSARCQAFTGSDTVHVEVHLLQQGVYGGWWGTRVTACGADTATSSGVSMSPGNSSYATDVNLTASTTNPIKYLQLGTDLYTNAAGTTSRGLIRLTAGTSILAQDLPYYESTTLENVNFTLANFMLAHMRFNIPAGTALKISAMRNVAAATRGWAAYGVD